MDARTRTRSTAAGRLQVLATGIADVLDQHRSADAEDWWIVAQLRPALEHALDLLLNVATDIGLDDPQARTAISTRDAVEIHLRAAADIEAADARPEVYTKVLVDAAELVVSEATAHRPTKDSTPRRPRC